MSLRHAILCMVINHPKSGYDIAKEFSGSVNFYWEASHQQIYKTLSELESKQWLKVMAVEQAGKPNKKDYEITSLGKKELLKWVEHPTKTAPRKNALLIKLLAMEEVGASVLIKELRRYQLGIEQQLAVFQKIEVECFQQDKQGVESLAYVSQHLALRRGISFTKAELEWLSESLATLESLPLDH